MSKFEPETVLKLEKTGLDVGTYLIVDQLSKPSIFDFNIWDFLTFVLGDSLQRFIINSDNPKLQFMNFLQDFPYDNILERVLITEILRIIYVALSTNPELSPTSILIDFAKLNFSLGISDSLYPLVDSEVVSKKELHKNKDLCDKHPWLWALVGPCVGIKASKWFWDEKVPEIVNAAENAVLGKGTKKMLQIMYKFFENSPIIVISGLLWLLLSQEGREFVKKGAQPASTAVSAGLGFAPLLFL